VLIFQLFFQQALLVALFWPHGGPPGVIVVCLTATSRTGEGKGAGLDRTSGTNRATAPIALRAFIKNIVYENVDSEEPITPHRARDPHGFNISEVTTYLCIYIYMETLTHREIVVSDSIVEKSWVAKTILSGSMQPRLLDEMTMQVS
jgi:hypothetical protein